MNKENYVNRKKSVYFFLSNLTGGGAQRTIVNILRALDRGTFSPKLILLDYNIEAPYASLIPNDIEIVNLKSRARNSIFQIKKLIDNGKPDVILSTLPQVNLAVWIAKKIASHKPRLILRETNFRETNFNTSQLRQKLYSKMYNDADLVIGLSEGITNHMKRTYKLPTSKIKTIYNPIDIQNIEYKSKDGCDISYKGKIGLVSCGRLVTQKNYNLVINAIKNLQDSYKEKLELFIIGEGPEKENLQELINEKKLGNTIKLLGFKKNPYSYMNQADLFVLSSLWEGFGHVIVESMASGTPVLANDCPHGPREILGDGNYGWLVKNNDVTDFTAKLEYLIRNQDELTKMNNKIKERANDFDLKKVTKEYESIL